MGLGLLISWRSSSERGHFERKHLWCPKRTSRFKGGEHGTHFTMGGVSKNFGPYFKTSIVIQVVGIDNIEADIW